MSQLQEVIDTVSTQLTTRLSSSERDLLSDDLMYFLKHLQPIGEALSSELSKIALHLRRIAFPEEVRQGSRTRTPNLSYLVQKRHQGLSLAKESLADSRLKLAMAASSVLEIHRDVIENAIRLLEQTKYGSVARGIRAHTEHLAIVAESMYAKLQYGVHPTAPVTCQLSR